MFLIYCFSLLILVTSEECGIRKIGFEEGIDTLNSAHNLLMEGSRVVGGSTTKPHSWPWAAQLILNGSHRCGGVLIDNKFILTAAHCFVRSRNPKFYKIRLGGHKSGGGVAYNISTIAIHDLFNVAWPNSYDIALLKLETEVEMNNQVRKICLPTLPAPTSRMCVVAGWGAQQESGKNSEELREIHVPIVPWYECNNSERFKGRVHLPSMICAGYDHGNQDSCQGDSGGPLMCEFNGKWEAHGLVSWGLGCGRRGHPGVYASVYSVLPWIHYQMWVLQNK